MRRGGRRGLRQSIGSAQAIPPTVSSISPSLGDVLGSLAVTVSGTGFTGATAVTIGGTACTSVVVVNATTITCVTPAKAAGTYDVAVTATTGTGTLSSGFEAFDPTTSATGFWEAGSYAISGGTGTWTKRVGTNLTEATFEPDDNPAGTPDFVAGGDSVQNTDTMATLLGAVAGDCSGLAVLDLDSISANSGTVSLNEAVWGDHSLTTGLFLRDNSGTRTATFLWSDGAAKTAAVTLAGETGRMCIQFRRVGTEIQIKLDGGSWSAATTVGNLSASTGQLRVGKLAAGIDGRIKALILRNATVSDANATKFVTWASGRHP